MATERRKGDTSKGQGDTYNEISADYQAMEGMKLMELASIGDGSRVLDLGCGTGRLTAVLAERVGSKGHVVGIDPDKERLKTAREKNSRANITYFDADGETFPEGPYDLVFSNYVLHWIEDKEPVFKRVSENLCTGGKFAFIIEMEHAPLLFEALGFFEPEKLILLDRKIFHVALEKLAEMAIRKGFVVTYKKLDNDHFLFPDVDTLLQFLYASSGGELDPQKANKELLEKFKQKYSDKTVDFSSAIAYFILSKQ